jgi:DNA polymerase-3 subunit alpha
MLDGAARVKEVVAAAARYQDIFGRDSFFIELQDHGLEPQRRIMPDLLDIARRIDAPLLATNDAHYTRRDEAEAHDVLLCIQTGSNRDDPRRLKLGNDQFYLKSAAEMRAAFPDDVYPGACSNTLWVAERSNVALDLGRILLPQFPVPPHETEASYLERLVREGAAARYGSPLPAEVEERIAHELRIISEMGFPAYFLVVWDLIRHAREEGIRVGPGRGSAAGSIVAYSLRITDLDPLAYGLIFERFLHPGRRQMPDIDMDFDERYRGEMIRYATEKYGSGHVAQIITFSTIKGKQAIRDSARVLGHPYSLGDRVAKAMPPPILGKEATLEQVLIPPPGDAEPEVRDWYSNGAELRRLYEGDEVVREVVDVARGLEGLRRQDSIHAAAVVISPVPLTDLVPVQQKGEGAELVTQYEMYGIEALGLLKMDFLGLRNLSIIERTLELIEERGGVRVDLDAIPLDDAPTYRLLSSGDTVGVFQLEGGGLRSLVRSLQPDRFEDIVALVALYRPGPLGQQMHTAYADRKNGRAPIQYPHPATEKYLRTTYGIIVYQEQVMQLAQEMAGYTMTEAEELRRAMGKKVKAMMQAQRQKFIEGCVGQGHTAQLGGELFDAIEPFAGYGFNRAHSACYGLIAYQTAWLKAHYPSEYMAALLTGTKRDKDRTAVYLNECRSLGLEVLVPDVNESQSDFSVADGKIRFGLSAVRNVGESAVERIIAARDKEGPFADFTDFVGRVDPLVLNRRTLESLIKAGAFDSVGHARKALFMHFEEIMDAALERRRNEDMGQFSLFEGTPAADEPAMDIGADEWSQRTKLGFEKEMLGLYVSDHPLLAAQASLRSHTPISGLADHKDGSPVTVGGLVGPITRRWTKKGEPMLFFQFEDLEGSIEVVAFPAVVAVSGPLVAEDAVLVVSGRVDNRGDDVKLVAKEIAELALRPDDELRIEVPARRLSTDVVGRLQAVLSNHPGSVPVYLHMVSDRGRKVLRLSDEYRVEPRSALYAEIRELLGQRAVL